MGDFDRVAEPNHRRPEGNCACAASTARCKARARSPVTPSDDGRHFGQNIAGAAVSPLVLPLRWRAVLSPCYPALCFEIPKMELKGFSRFTENGSGSAVSSLMIAGRECLHREERLSISVWYRSRH